MPGTSIVPAGFPQYHWQPTADQDDRLQHPGGEQDLDDAGYKMGPDGLRIDPKTGKPLIFRFFLLTSQPQEIKEAPFIKGWLKQIGIQLNTQVMTEGKFTDDWSRTTSTCTCGDGGRTRTPTSSCRRSPPARSTPGATPATRTRRTTRCTSSSASSSTRTARKKILDQMQQIIYNDVPEVVLYYEEDLQAYRTDRWTGFVNQPQPQGFKLFAYSNYSYLSLHIKSANAAAPVSSSGDLGLRVAGRPADRRRPDRGRRPGPPPR